MSGFVCANNQGKYPLKKVQFEMLYKKCKELSKIYQIPIANNMIMTHYEFGKYNPKTTSKGKIDIIFIPHEPILKQDDIGNYLRDNIKKCA